MKYLHYLFAITILAGLIPASLAGKPGDLIWTAQTGDTVFGSPGIGPLGEVVVGSYDQKVYSFNPDGSLRWSVQVGSDWLESSPTIGPDGTVYIASWDGFLYALDGDTGNEVWHYETGGFITASAALGPDGTIYVGSNDGFLYAINPSGTLKWYSTDLPRISPINCSPVFNKSGTTVYFGTDMGDFFALSTADGSTLWSFYVTNIHPASNDLDNGIMGSPAIDFEGNLYFGCENTYLYSLTSEGSLRWTFQAVESIYSSPVISNTNTLYFTAQDGYLYFLGLNGVQEWETYVGDVIYCSPSLDAEGNIIIAGYAGSAATGAATDFTSVSSSGSILWEYHINSLNDSSPNIAPDGSIYIGAHDGYLYKIEGSSGLMDGQWPRAQANRRQTGYADDLGIEELVDFFPLISESAAGWALVPWFGTGWIVEEDLPWIRHIDHGLIYLSQTSPGNSWFYDTGLKDWLYASASYPYYYYQYGTASWLFHLPGTTVESGRWFYDFGISDWKQ